MNCVRTVTALFATLLLCACEHKELCLHTWLDHNKGAYVRVDVDWSNFDAEEPTGMTLSFFSTDQEKLSSVSTNDIYSYTTQLPVGTYHVNVINLSPDELYTVEFQGLEAGSNPTIVGTSSAMPSFVLSNLRESVNTEPQEMATDIVYNVVVPANATDTVVVKMIAQPVLYTVDIAVEVSGYSRIQRMYGMLANVADGYNAISQLPLSQTANYEVSDWSIAPLDADSDRGILSASALIFGVPPMPDNSLPDIDLKIYMLLKDGKTFFSKSFTVGEYFLEHVNRHYNIYISEPIVLPEIDIADTTTSGAFDANVSDWDDEIIIEFK